MFVQTSSDGKKNRYILQLYLKFWLSAEINVFRKLLTVQKNQRMCFIFNTQNICHLRLGLRLTDVWS